MRPWAGDHGLDLDDGPDTLPPLDRLSTRWATEPGVGSALDHDAGCYLGTVIVKQLPGAVRQAWSAVNIAPSSIDPYEIDSKDIIGAPADVPWPHDGAA